MILAYLSMAVSSPQLKLVSVRVSRVHSQTQTNLSLFSDWVNRALVKPICIFILGISK